MSVLLSVSEVEQYSSGSKILNMTVSRWAVFGHDVDPPPGSWDGRKTGKKSESRRRKLRRGGEDLGEEDEGGGGGEDEEGGEDSGELAKTDAELVGRRGPSAVLLVVEEASAEPPSGFEVDADVLDGHWEEEAAVAVEGVVDPVVLVGVGENPQTAVPREDCSGD